MFNNLLYKSSEAELKLMTNINEYLTVENNIYDSMIMINYQYVKINNL